MGGSRGGVSTGGERSGCSVFDVFGAKPSFPCRRERIFGIGEIPTPVRVVTLVTPLGDLSEDLRDPGDIRKETQRDETPHAYTCRRHGGGYDTERLVFSVYQTQRG